MTSAEEIISPSDAFINLIKSLTYESSGNGENNGSIDEDEGRYKFPNPFKNFEKLNAVEEEPSQELIDLILKPNSQETNKDEDENHDQATKEESEPEEKFSYMPLSNELQEILVQGFSKARLHVEKPKQSRGSVSGRKMSTVSFGSMKRPSLVSYKDFTKESKILSARFSGSRRKSSNITNLEDIAECNKSRSSSAIQKRMQVKAEKKVRVATSKDFILFPGHGNSNFTLFNGNDNKKEEEENEINSDDSSAINKLTWSKKEKARRKVNNWLLEN